ncbi:hypothetical protein Tco_1263053 [Tanacetum coccineum]
MYVDHQEEWIEYEAILDLHINTKIDITLIHWWVMCLHLMVKSLPDNNALEIKFDWTLAKLEKIGGGKPFVILSITELQAKWSSFSDSNCEVEYLGGSRFSLEFKCKQEEYDLSKFDSKTGVDLGIEIETESNKPILVPIADDIRAKKGSVETEVVDESSFPAQVRVKDNLKFELKLVDSFVKDEVHVSDYGSVSYVVKDEMLLSSEGIVGLVKPRPTKLDLLNIISYALEVDLSLSKKEIRDGFFSKYHTLPPQIKETDASHHLEKFHIT